MANSYKVISNTDNNNHYLLDLPVITIREFRQALLEVLAKRGIPKYEIEKMAEYVMNFFGFQDWVVDNLLTAQDRDVFYMLEEEGILYTLREEAMLQKGKLWRIHYWILNHANIRNLFKIAMEKRQQRLRCEDKKLIVEEADIYKELEEEVWRRRRK